MHSTRRTFGVLAIAATLLAASAASDRAARAGDAPRAIDAIENDLVADDPAVRAKAAAELTDRFPDGAVAVPMLVDLLDDEDASVVAAAATAIDSMAVAGLKLATSWCTVDAHIAVKTRFGEQAGVLLTLRGPTALDAIDYAEIPTGKVPTDSAILAALLPQRQSSHSPQALLLTVFRRTTGEARAMTAAAMAMQADEVAWQRGVAPAASPGRAAAGSAAGALVKSDSEMKAWIGARLVLRARAADAATVSALTAAMSSPKSPLKIRGQEIHVARPEACRALGRLGPAAAVAAPALLDVAGKARERGGPEVDDAVRALLAIGKEADVLALLARKPPEAGTVAATLACEGRSAATVIPFLVAAAQDDPFAFEAFEGLRVLGAAAAPAVPGLLDMCKQADDDWHRLRYVDTILAISPSDAAALKHLEAAIADAGTSERHPGEALAVLALRGVAGPQLAARLKPIVTQAASAAPADFVAPGGTIDGLARCGAAAKASVPDLVRILAIEDGRCGDLAYRTPSATSRRRVAVALGRIGPDAAAAIPALTALRDKGDETIRVAAAQALRRIRAKK